MRTKIIAGNLVAVLVVGLVSYFVVSGQIRATFLEEVDTQIANDAQVFERTWRLSGLEFVAAAAEQASASDTQDVFTALDESGQRDRAFRRANAVADWFGRQHRAAGPPELVVITDDRGIGIARNQDRNRMHGEDLKRQLGTLEDALDSGEATVDVWSFSSGQDKLLQTAIAPIRDPEGAVRGAVIIGYDMSNGMATRSGELLGRDVVFFTEGQVYSSSLPGDLADQLRAMLFDAHSAVTGAALSGGGATSDPFAAEVGDDQFAVVAGALPLSPSTAVGYAVLGNRTAQESKASAVNMILIMTGLGLLIVLVYGFLIGTSLLKPIEEMEEGVLAVINGRTDLRLDIESAELGGLAYRINQLLTVVTGTPEEDEDGRASSPPEALSEPRAPAGGAAPAPSGGDEEDPELAAKLSAEPEDEYYARVYREYVAAKEAAGENVSNITQERFVQRLQANEKSLIKKHGCRMVRFQVQVKGTQVNLRPVIIR